MREVRNYASMEEEGGGDEEGEAEGGQEEQGPILPLVGVSPPSNVSSSLPATPLSPPTPPPSVSSELEGGSSPEPEQEGGDGHQSAEATPPL